MERSDSPAFSDFSGFHDDLSVSNSYHADEEEEGEKNDFNAAQKPSHDSPVENQQQPVMNGYMQHPTIEEENHGGGVLNGDGDSSLQGMIDDAPQNVPLEETNLVGSVPMPADNINVAPLNVSTGEQPLDSALQASAGEQPLDSALQSTPVIREQHFQTQTTMEHNDYNIQNQQNQQQQQPHAASVSLTPTPVASEYPSINNNSNDNSQDNNQKQAALGNPTSDHLIELLEDDDDQHQQGEAATLASNFQSAMNGASESYYNKRPKLSNGMEVAPPSAGEASYQARAAVMPDWMRQQANGGAMPPPPGQIIHPGHSLYGFSNHNAYASRLSNTPQLMHNPYSMSTPSTYHPSNSYATSTYTSSHYQDPSIVFDNPTYAELPSDFVPTWTQLIPQDLIKRKKSGQKKAYQLSLVSLTEFTITGLPLYPDGPPTPVAGLRKTIKQISREHGKAVFEKNRDGVDGQWKIPIGAYHSFVAFLQADPKCIRLEPIPQMQLKIASLGAAREEKGLPSPSELNKKGVPLALANTLAPFQRGGVDFVLEREGRALVADEMGLGKTIQAVASMSVYHKEWPLLVLTPSGARYHWESEFRNWLGVNGAAAKKSSVMEFHDGKQPADDGEDCCDFELLSDDQINVLTSSKVKIFPNKNTRVVICSYGLAPMLVESNKIRPGMFPCAIADESHMLKNIKSKRTAALVPVLNACSRVVLLSGTPALSKPLELWPQLQILRISGQPGFWDDEREFQEKYVKRNNARHRAELATMLKGTVMIRRLKDNILKEMPRKVREKATVQMESEDMKRRMQECMELLREGKGVLGKLARQHSAVASPIKTRDDGDGVDGNQKSNPAEPNDEQVFQQLLNGHRRPAADGPEAELEQSVTQRYKRGQDRIQHALVTSNHLLDPNQVNDFVSQMDLDLRAELRTFYFEQKLALRSSNPGGAGEDEPPSRSSVLSTMYSLTGKSKVPAIIQFLKKWLSDPTKGKICVFAHHIFVLNEVASAIGLSNSGEEGTHRFIRIDGSTSPRSRQEQIDSFQNDPKIRVAMLGITAAGVAVTLTASSHVLFAELFWTPAIMIQAEDRCHRIGQQARVKCLYFVAKGTLDDILWKLIEKKFRELGEFVEGKEKLKMVVDKVFKNEEELNSIFNHLEGEESDYDDDNIQPDQAESSGEEILPLDNDLEHDIEELGREEQEMLASADRDDEDGEIESGPAAANEVANVVEETNIQGRSEEDAIALSDSEEEDQEAENSGTSMVKAVNPDNKGAVLNKNGTLPDCRIYKMWLRGPSLSVEVGCYKERLVVSRKLSDRMQRLGKDCKPDVGDILVAVDHQLIPPVTNLDHILDALRRVLQQGKPAQMWFAEDPEFKEHYMAATMQGKSTKRQREDKSDGARAQGDNSDVIVLIDD